MKKTSTLAALLVLSFAVLLLAPLAGVKPIMPQALLNFSLTDTESAIFWKIRLPRVLLSFSVGAVLALGGMAFQSIFRNPLATPFTLGVSSGASFGAVVYLKLGLTFSLLGISGISLSAFAGALVVISVVYLLSTVKNRFSSQTMLLAGVAAGFFFSSLILFIQYLSDFTDSFRILRWLMGGLSVIGFDSLLSLLPFALIGTCVVLYYLRDLDMMLTGEELAIGRGVNVNGTRKAIFFAVSLMIGATVAVCGPIGFIGMISPHICRLLIGQEHRYLAPASLLFGGLFLTLCDTFARIVIAPAEIPVGVITALLGGPFFLWLLLGKEN